MLRKLFICALVLTTFLVTGCGEEKIVGTPDKAILAYAELAMTGESENISAAGFSEKDREEIRRIVANTFIKSVEDIAPLSEQSAQELTKIYFEKLKGEVKFKTVLTRDDKDNPIVELTTTPIDQAATARKSAAKNDEIIALIGMVGHLKSEGMADEDLRQNPDVQKLAVTALTKYISDITFQPEKTLEVPCRKMEGSNGNMHWVPTAGDVLISFLTGQN